MTAWINKYVIGGVLLITSAFSLWFAGRRGATKDAEVKAAKAETEEVRKDAQAEVTAVEHHAATVEKANEITAQVNAAPGSSVERLRKSKWNTDGKGN